MQNSRLTLTRVGVLNRAHAEPQHFPACTYGHPEGSGGFAHVQANARRLERLDYDRTEPTDAHCVPLKCGGDLCVWHRLDHCSKGDEGRRARTRPTSCRCSQGPTVYQRDATLRSALRVGSKTMKPIASYLRRQTSTHFIGALMHEPGHTPPIPDVTLRYSNRLRAAHLAEPVQDGASTCKGFVAQIDQRYPLSWWHE